VDERKAQGPVAIGIDLIQDISDTSHPLEGFLRRHRHRAKTRLSDGTRTDIYVADFIDRDPGWRDAVAVAIFSADEGTKPDAVRVLLRRQVRYAAYLVTAEALFTEVVAGLIELPESSIETAVRELYEEAGLEVGRADVHALGDPFFILPGTVTERIVPMAARVSKATLAAAAGTIAPGDGSPLEEGAELIDLSLEEALGRIYGERRPAIKDAKTEIVLSRLLRALERGTL
jgi:8-oxo-dGTP pyrophosphatase MutT (NUDIX family)